MGSVIRAHKKTPGTKLVYETGYVGHVYLVHFSPAYRHCEHYVGFTAGPVSVRLAQHRAGLGAGLTGAAVLAGCEINHARVWPDVGQEVEFYLKSWSGLRRLCPVCTPKWRVYGAKYGESYAIEWSGTEWRFTNAGVSDTGGVLGGVWL